MNGSRRRNDPRSIWKPSERRTASSAYPEPATIQPGRPLVVVEGEFDALALGEALGELAAVVTLGSASSEPTPVIIGRFLSANPWFVATDSDTAGTKAASKWDAFP